MLDIGGCGNEIATLLQRSQHLSAVGPSLQQVARPGRSGTVIDYKHGCSSARSVLPRQVNCLDFQGK